MALICNFHISQGFGDNVPKAGFGTEVSKSSACYYYTELLTGSFYSPESSPAPDTMSDTSLIPLFRYSPMSGIKKRLFDIKAVSYPL